MIKNEPIIGVFNVEKSSKWYQKLLNCNSSHGGSTFEMLTDNTGEVFLCLHKWGEHEHPTLSSPQIPPGNGLILYLRVEDLNKVWNNAKELKLEMEEARHMNPNSGKEQFCLRDLDGYYLMITE
ncbi:VOC family protein [uncultured Kriegella sp.]|uniref:VOC family protein n=1 Tax=uncultured Kriegella sp. TaxID=1798910 RepID=UPI0030D8904B|tara:strand:+ start:66730 stop:67101 length:372 start_codon:yes stop_codon:yes gene_type:complete